MKQIQKKTKLMLEVEELFGENIEELLRILYVEKDLRYDEIAKVLGVSRDVVVRWLPMAGIYSRRLDIREL